MMSAALLAAALVIVAVGLDLFVKANPANVAVVVRNGGGWLVLALAGLLLLRGQFILAAPLAAFGVYLLRRSGGSGSRPEGRKSRVRTAKLAMELDHATGDMDGEVLSGIYAGRLLSSLDLSELMQLHGECVEDGPQSSALLEAFLDRAHPDWRDDPGYAGDTEQKSHSGSSQMTREEAFEILGLAFGATKEEIRKAHKALMKKYHPDQGGSSYIASKINQAKDLLLQ